MLKCVNYLFIWFYHEFNGSYLKKTEVRSQKTELVVGNHENLEY